MLRAARVFIGSNLVKLLLDEGHDVIVLDDFSVGTLGNLDILKPYNPLENKSLKIMAGSVTDLTIFYSLAMEVDTIFHLAVQCLVRCNEDFKLGHDVNAGGTFNACLAAKRFNCKLVYVSTSEVYGNALHTPMDEGHPTNPQSVYGMTKLVGEQYVSLFNKIHNVPAVIVRPFNSFGPNHRGDQYAAVITNFVKRALSGKPLIVHGTGQQSRDWTYVSDTAYGIYLLSKLSDGEIVNVGSGSRMTVNQLAETISKICGVERNIIHEDSRPNDVFRLEADITLARKYGYSPIVTLEEGLRKYVEWRKVHEKQNLSD